MRYLNTDIYTLKKFRPLNIYKPTLQRRLSHAYTGKRFATLFIE